MTNKDDLTSRKAELSEARRALLLKRLQGKKTEPESSSGIERRRQSGPLPLSYAQQRVWFLQQLFPDNRAYNMHEAWRVRGPLDVEALRLALNAVARQQASLRTRFVAVNDEPMQLVADEIELPLPVIDISHLPPAQRGAKLLDLIWTEGNYVFDLSTGPLVCMSLVRLGYEEHALLLTLHHIITDEWSNDVFWRELNAGYAHAQQAGAVTLREPPIQYGDYAQWQREQVTSGALKEQSAYWQTQLSGDLPLLQLPFDRPRASTQSLKGGLLWRRLSPDLLAGMQALSQRAGATLYMTLLAAFQALLHRYSSQDDILVGTPIANRQRLETKNVMGMFINTAVMRADFSGSPNFLQLLDQVRQTALDALANQDFPFDLLVQSMHPNRDLSHNPLFQTMFVYLSNEVERGLPDTQFEPIEVDHGVAKFDLTMFAGEENSCLTLALEYNSDLFDEATAVRMLDHFQTLLQAIVEDPHAPIAALPLLSPKEQTLVLESWNETAVPFTETRCLHALIDARAAQHPDAVAVIAQDQRLTYDQLVRRANGLAHALVARGVGPGTPVGLFVERSAEMLVGILGILKAGGAYVPLEPGYPSERIAFALADTAAPLIVTQAQLTGQLPPTDAAVVVLDAEDPGSDTPPETAVTLDHLAYTIYTSGSTGTPKGVMVTHRNLLSSTLARSAYYDAPVQRYLLLSSFAFDSSVAGLFWTLADGGALVLPAPDEEKDVPRLAGLVAQEQVTHTLALPTLYRLLLTYAPDSALSSLQVVIVAGEACPLDLGRLHYDRLPRSTLYNEYGPTEATVWCSVYRVPPSSDGRSVPIGRPIANTQLYILDGQCQPVPIGVPGELYVGGSGVTPGYLNRPALTAERFIPDRFSPPGKQSGAAALYRTGDLARWRPDGEIEFLGRVDNQVKIRGFRIEPGEIEAALVEHPAVQEAAVAVWEVDSGKRLAAYVVGDAARAKSVQLQSYLGERLPDYMVPRQITFLPALPRTPNGKVDRSQLPRPFPETDRERPFVPPRSPAEKTLARLWCEVLQLPQVSVEDKFFDLGGDSIMSIQVVARARQEGLILTPRQMFREQTIARLAAVATVAGEPVAPQTDVSGPVPLTPIQHWFFEQQLANPNHWNQAEWFETAADLDANTLRAALGFLSQQHPILRARFRLVDGVWQQKILPSAPLPALEHISLTGLDPAAQDATMLAEANRLHAGLDLVDGPLVGGALFTLGTGRRPRLLLVIHHLVIDAVSWGTLTANLQTAYRQLAVGEPVSLPAPTAGYAQWATLLTKLAQDDALRRELDYWRQIGATQTALPTDGPGNGRDTEGQSELLTVTLDSRRTHSLLRDVHQTYHTRIEDVLLTALARAMTSWTNTPSLLLTLEHHGREELDAQLDVSQTVGWFTSLFPIRLELGELTDVGANLRAVKEQLRSVPQNGVGYGILRYLGDEAVRRQLASQPGPQILFNYLGEGGSMARQDGLLRPLPADIGQAYGPQNARAHLIDINARVENGRFTAVWQYDASRFANATIQRVADAYIAELARLVDHCLSIEQDQHTPSDFPLANLEQADLDSLSDLLAELD